MHRLFAVPIFIYCLAILLIGGFVYFALAMLFGVIVMALFLYHGKKLAKLTENSRVKVIFDKAPYAISFWSHDWKLIDVNETFMVMFNAKDKPTLLKEFPGLYTPPFQPCGTPSGKYVMENTDKAVKFGSYKFNLMHQDKAGNPVPCEIVSVSTRFDGKNVIIAYARDLMEEEKLTSELSAANERARIIFEKAPLAITFWSREFVPIDCNDECARVFSLESKDEYLGNFMQYSKPVQPCGTEAAEKASLHFREATEKGMTVFEWMHEDSNGLPLPCEITLISIKQEHSSHSFVSYLTDLREHYAHQKKIDEANMKLRLMLDSTPLACFLIDSEFNAIDCNMEAVFLFGYNEKEDCIRSFDDIIRCDGCSEYNRRCEAGGMRCRLKYIFLTAISEGHAKVEWMLQAPELGTQIPCEINYVRLEFKDEYIIAAYITDLRNLKKMVEDKKKLEIAEENSLAKSRFLASMSHEIRTPMNAILGITEIQLAKLNLPEDMRDAFEKIFISGDMLMGIINDVLDLSKIEAGKMELEIEKYELISMIHDTVVLNLMRIESKDVKFELFVDENAPAYLMGDELRIKQILNNILSNSFKYTAQGVVKMHVNFEPTDDTGLCLLITISDTGQGMSKDDVSRLFESYARFNTASNRTVQGTGLGMSITHNLLKLMDGSITVESELGVGSVFLIKLPQIKASNDIVGREAADNLSRFQFDTRATMKRAQITYEPMPYGKILIIDDVEMNIYVAKGLMSPYMLSIDSADSGFGAIKKIESGNVYDIIFMDHMMPMMDGIETTKRIRALGYTEPIVALTANAITGQADIFLKSGFDDFISKPIDIRQLNLVLNKLIRDKQAAEVLEAARRENAEIIENEESFDEYMKSPEFLEMVYRDFVASHSNCVEEIKKAITAGDFKTAHFLTHSVKGIAGLMGESELLEIYTEAEHSFRRERVPVEIVEKLYAETTRILESAKAGLA